MQIKTPTTHRPIPVLCLFFLALSFSACNFKDEKNSADEPVATVDPNQSVGFDEINSKIFATSCVRCHSSAGGNQGGVNLETYAQVQSLLTRIKSSTVTSTRMPVGDTLDKSLIALLKVWIDQGGPEKAK